MKNQFLFRMLIACCCIIISQKSNAQSLCGATSINLTTSLNGTVNPSFICLPVCTSSTGAGCTSATITVEVTRTTPFTSPSFSSSSNVAISTTTTVIVSSTVRRYSCTVRSNDNASNNDWTAGTVSFNYSDPSATCGCVGTRSVAINKSGPYPVSEGIAGPNCISPNSSHVFSIRPRYTVGNSNGDFYTWSNPPYPTGVTETYRSGDASSLTLNFGSTFEGPLTLSVIPGKCNSVPITKQVGVQTSSALPILSVPANASTLCLTSGSLAATNLRITSPGLINSNYTWNISASTGFTVSNISFATPNQVNFTVTPNSGTNCSGSVSATATPNANANNCGTLTINPFVITRELPAGGAITSISPIPLVDKCVAYGADGQGVFHEFAVPNTPCSTNIAWTPPTGWLHVPYSSAFPPATPPTPGMYRIVPTSQATIGQLIARTCGNVTYTRDLALTIKRATPTLNLVTGCCGSYIQATFTPPVGCTAANYRCIWTHSNPNGFGQGVNVVTSACGVYRINSTTANQIQAGIVTCFVVNCGTAECLAGCSITDAGIISLASAVPPGTNTCCRSAVDDQQVEEPVVKGTADLSIFPNPASGMVNIASKDDSKITEVMMFNSLGKIISVKKVNLETTTTFDVKGQAKGIYTFIILTDGKPYTKQIAIE